MLKNKLSLVVLGMGMGMVWTVPALAQNMNGSDYNACIEASGGADKVMQTCINQETDRVTKAVEGKYETLANAGYFKNWNQGSGMYSGNFRTLLNTWKQYRDKYCSLYGYSISTNGTLGELSSSECMLELTKRQNKDLDVVLKNYKENE